MELIEVVVGVNEDDGDDECDVVIGAIGIDVDNGKEGDIDNEDGDDELAGERRNEGGCCCAIDVCNE
ncbi:hypothetical protein QR98_0010180 [Sarcoptes scabiei]|uniref:Uncharacterized protein n=1 Tax=Sarcoptes scabiei TaxID=52283 RepID=A0A131ZUW8_SARSC|nr:hypothetical protein QR98_0010180 [Sarcoptes scabiei]